MMRHVTAFLLSAFVFVCCTSRFAQGNQEPIANADVIKMVQSGMSEDAILHAIRMATPNFDITDKSVLEMKRQKVSETVILAMIKRQWQWNSRQHKVHAVSRDSGPRWEVEFHGGIPGNMHQTGGMSETPAAQKYSLAGSGAVGYWSKSVSSWYFGDGAELIGLSSSLDSILNKPGIKTRGGMLGFRASRSFNKWVAAELSFDCGSRLSLSQDTRTQVEAARKSFESFWSRLNVPGNTPSTSASTIAASGGNQIFTTGGIVISLPLAGKVKPFVTVGAGVLSNGGSTPTITLNGSYGGPSAQETDSVRLSFYRDSNHIFTQMFGGGFKIYLTPHWGIRVDARAYLYHNPYSTTLDASHTNAPDAAWIINATDGADNIVARLQRLTGPGIEAYSTLSGPTISGLKTYIGSGTQHQFPLSLGLFYRF
jgi:hypothetical protein